MNSKFLNFYYRLQDAKGKNHVVITVGAINIDNNMHSYIQIYSNKSKKTVYLKYNIADFTLYLKPQCINIDDNLFGLDLISMNIKKEELRIFGKIKSKENIICKHDIMGPFSKVNYLSCKTGLFNLHSKIDGYLYIDNKKVDFTNGTLYVQGENGNHMPDKYIWAQSNKMINKKLSNNKNSFTICLTRDKNMVNTTSRYFFISFLLEGIQYVFSTYNGGRVKEVNIKKRLSKDVIDIKIKQNDLIFDIRIIKSKGHVLSYPFKDSLKKVNESLTSTIILIAYKEDKNKKYNMILKTKFKDVACQMKV